MALRHRRANPEPKNAPMNHRPALAALALLAAGHAAPAAANDFPTLERVRYVQECMRQHPGPQFEMTSKCSCALDNIADKVKYDDFVSMSTVANALTIGGERGGALRDNESIKPEAKRYRELQAQALKSCFITP